MLLLGKTPASEFYMPTFRNTLFHVNKQVGMKMEQPERSETSAYEIQTPVNFQEESIQQKVVNLHNCKKKYIDLSFIRDIYFSDMRCINI